MTETQINIKNYLTELITTNLKDFDLVKGAEQRTIGDLIEHQTINIIKDNQGEIIQKVKPAKGKKSTEDVAFINENVKYLLDLKSHNFEADFSMPNLISIEKLRKLLTNRKKEKKPAKKLTKKPTKKPTKIKKPEPLQELIYVLIDYKIESNIVKIKSVKVVFVWEMDMSMLVIGALGNGQLQIKNLNKDLIFTTEGKKIWFQKLKVEVKDYLEKQIIKIKKLQEEWENVENELPL
jgi:hypothetical protein